MNNEELEENQRMSLDALLAESLGQFGWFQFRTVAFCCIFVIFVAFTNNAYVFTTARTQTRCLIPECDGDNPEFSPEWLMNAVPSTGSSFDSCTRFGTSIFSHDSNGTCPATLFYQNVTVPCGEYVYADNNSVVYDFGLACNEWKRSLIGTFRQAGMFIAMPLTGTISDRWGRRTALVYNSLTTAVIGLTRSFIANSYKTFVILEVLESTLASAGYSCAYVLVMELVGPKYRVISNVILSTFSASGTVTLAMIAWAVPDWRQLTRILYSPHLISIFYLLTMTESVRWLMSKNKYKDSERILKKAAKINKREITEEFFSTLRMPNEEKQFEKQAQLEDIDDQWLVLLVFKHKTVLLRCLVCPLLWMTNMLVYYGLSLNAVTLSGNNYINYAAVCAVEIPGVWMAVFLNKFLGRKPILIGAFFMCASCMVCFMVLPDHMVTISLILYLFGKCNIAMSGLLLYTYTSELFPTQCRHRLLAFCAMIGRVGSMTAPLTPALGETIWSQFPFALFAGFCIMSGCLMFFMPETVGTKLPDTMEEAVQIGSKVHKREKIVLR